MNSRVSLRPFKIADAGQLYENLQSDPYVYLYLDQDMAADESESREYIKARIPYYAREHFYDYAIVFDDRVIGEINAAYTASKNAADLGYAIGSEYWNQGIASEAVRQLLAILKEDGISSVYGAVTHENTASRKVLEHAGFSYTGTVPEAVRKKEDTDGLLWYVLYFE